jgi:hypothetical protein
LFRAQPRQHPLRNLNNPGANEARGLWLIRVGATSHDHHSQLSLPVHAPLPGQKLFSPFVVSLSKPLNGAEEMLLPSEMGRIGHPVLSDRTYALHAKKRIFGVKNGIFPVIFGGHFSRYGIFLG